MAKDKTSIAIDPHIHAKIKAVGRLENRSVSNSIEELLDFTNYEFIESNSKVNNDIFLVAVKK